VLLVPNTEINKYEINNQAVLKKHFSSTAETQWSPEGLLLSRRGIFTFVDSSTTEYMQSCCTEIFD